MKKIITFLFIFICFSFFVNGLTIKEKNDNTILYMPMNDNTGDDTSIYNIDMTNVGATVTSGKINNSNYFDNSDYMYSSIEYSELKTFRAWFKTNSTDTYETFFSNNRFAQEYKGFYIGTYNGKIYIVHNYGTGNNFNFYTDDAYNDNEWHHLVFTWDRTINENAVKIWVDGVNVKSTTSNTINYFNPFYKAHIGREASGESGYFFKGFLDEVSISKIAWDSETIIEDYNLGEPTEKQVYVFELPDKYFSIEHILPVNNTEITTDYFTNYFKVYSNYLPSDINCSLYLNDDFESILYNVSINETLNFNTTLNMYNTYTYYVSCSNNETTKETDLYYFELIENSSSSNIVYNVTDLDTSIKNIMFVIFWVIITIIGIFLKVNYQSEFIFIISCIFGFLLSTKLIIQSENIIFGFIGLVTSILLYIGSKEK